MNKYLYHKMSYYYTSSYYITLRYFTYGRLSTCCFGFKLACLLLMDHGSHRSWVKTLMGYMGLVQIILTHCQLCTVQQWFAIAFSRIKIRLFSLVYLYIAQAYICTCARICISMFMVYNIHTTLQKCLGLKVCIHMYKPICV